MKKTTKMLAIALCLVLALGSLAGCAKKQEETVKIGFLGALTGDVANYGQPGLKGLQLAAEELNAKGGILGKPIEILGEDNRGDKTEAANLTTRYITQEKVAALVGDPCTGITKVAGKIAQDNQMVIISAGATGTGVCEIGDYVFRDTLLDSVAAPATVEYLLGQNFKKIALVTATNDDYSVGLSGIFRKAVKDKGAAVVIEESIQKGDTNFAAQVTNIKAANSDLIIFTGYYTEAGLFMKEVRKQGMKQLFVGGDGCLGPDLVKLGGKAVEGSMVYCGFSPEQPTPETKKFLDAYAKKYNGAEADMFAAQYYDALMILAKVMEETKSTDPKVYVKALAKTANFPGASGVITFQADREPIKSPVYLLTVQDGKFKLKQKIDVKVQ